MNTATLTRPALKALPGPTAGAFLAAHQSRRPCTTNPPQWWDTGNASNGQAISLCRTACPFIDTCAPTKDELKPLGVIRAGAAYDDRGRKQRLCHGCSGPLNKETKGSTCDRCRRGRLADQHSTIAEMVGAGSSWADISRVVGFGRDAVRRYWDRHGQVPA